MCYTYILIQAEHVEGFAKECAVVTHHRLCADPSGSGQLIPDPDAKLEEPLVVRPTRYSILYTIHTTVILYILQLYIYSFQRAIAC
jgi:prolyl-tRNA synthetase